MLRALRFASVYGMTIEDATALAIHRNKDLLKEIAAERTLVKLTKMLCGEGEAVIMRDFADVLAVPIPELAPMFGFEQLLLRLQCNLPKRTHRIYLRRLHLENLQ